MDFAVISSDIRMYHCSLLLCLPLPGAFSQTRLVQRVPLPLQLSAPLLLLSCHPETRDFIHVYFPFEPALIHSVISRYIQFPANKCFRLFLTAKKSICLLKPHFLYLLICHWASGLGP